MNMSHNAALKVEWLTLLYIGKAFHIHCLTFLYKAPTEPECEIQESPSPGKLEEEEWSGRSPAGLGSDSRLCKHQDKRRRIEREREEQQRQQEEDHRRMQEAEQSGRLKGQWLKSGYVVMWNGSHRESYGYHITLPS